MDEHELGCVIKFLWLSGKSSRDIVDEIQRVCGDGKVSLRTVQSGHVALKMGKFHWRTGKEVVGQRTWSCERMFKL